MAHPVAGIDHIAMTVRDIEVSADFYRRVLDAETPYEAAWRDGRIPVLVLRIGGATINLQAADNPAYIVADRPTPGAVDLCLRWSGPIATAEAHLRDRGIDVIEGPVPRFATDGSPGQSVYFRDPDDNLLELLSTAED